MKAVTLLGKAELLTNYTAFESQNLSGRCIARTDGTREDTVVLPAVLRPSPSLQVKIVLFDRSWYNRAGVERVMGFCTEEDYREYMRTCPEFERMLVRSGINLIKYWFSVADEEQEKRFQSRLLEPHKRWKLSPMDLESRTRWLEYSKAKDPNVRTHRYQTSSLVCSQCR